MGDRITTEALDALLMTGLGLVVTAVLGVTFLGPVLIGLASLIPPERPEFPTLAERFALLVGTVGLDPLDPIVPLAGIDYDPHQPAGDSRPVPITARFRYADGSSRQYRLLVQGPGRRPGSWQTTSADPLLATPPAGAPPSRRILVHAADRGQVFDLTPPRWDPWFSLSPDGAKLLLTNGRGSYWLAPLERDTGG